nr:putative transposase [Ipomoea batatas]
MKANCSPLRSISVVSYGHSANNSQSPMVVSTIRDLYERVEKGYYCVLGTIVLIESGKKWFYNSCRKPGCFKSLIFTETYYYCETCKTNWAEGNVRYRVVIRVLDKTSDAPFLLWDKDCFDFLGITSYDLKTKYSMVPAEFDQLRNKSMVFRINLKNEHIRNPAKPISVLSVMHDEELEGQYCPSMVDDHDELSRMVEEEADDLESDENELGDEAISPSMQPNLKLKGVDKAQDEVDTGAIKRCLLDQFSSSQNLKKSRPVVIKQKKN